MAEKKPYTVTYAPFDGKEYSFRRVLDRGASFQERENPQTEDRGWMPLEKFCIDDESRGLTCDMRSFATKKHAMPFPKDMTLVSPESTIRKEEILPFLSELKAKGIRWPLYATRDEAALMMANKYLRFFPLGDSLYTVNNRLGEPVDWKSILHFYDTKKC
ncbi:MAG: hypothetical protein IJ584_11150 [Bacteroidales bacterium]|nr:hypothetical protein [Bacteroidales bacterium]